MTTDFHGVVEIRAGNTVLTIFEVFAKLTRWN